MNSFEEELLAGKALWIGLEHDLKPGFDAASHATLVYVGKLKDKDALSASTLASCATVLVKQYATAYPAFDAQVGGVARFYSDKAQPHVLLLQNPVIRRIRDGILSVLSGKNIDVQVDFDYTPHITLDYLDDGTTLGIPVIQKDSIRFTHISVNCGMVKSAWALTGGLEL